MKKLSRFIMRAIMALVLLNGCNKPSSDKRILSFRFYEPAVDATIIERTKTIIANMPDGSNVEALVPIITVSENAIVNPGSGYPQDFTHSKTYIVTAEDGTQAVYTVTIVLGNGGDNNGGDNEDGNVTYSITTYANPTDGGTITGSGVYNEGALATLEANASTNYIFDHWQDGNSANPRTIIVSANMAYTAYFTYNGDGTVDGDANGHPYVDLGLPSGILWASCNVGATTPENYGNYYAWGETNTKTIYNWRTYLYSNGSFSTLTKYCSNSSYGNNGFTDSLTVLQLSDDAARANWGGGWRIPTETEWNELKSNTVVTWTTLNGVYGKEFTASNGNSLFLPAAGFRTASSVNDGGAYGFYWSNSIYTDYPSYAWCFLFNSDNGYMSKGRPREYGHSVRAVLPASQN